MFRKLLDFLFPVIEVPQELQKPKAESRFREPDWTPTGSCKCGMCNQGCDYPICLDGEDSLEISHETYGLAIRSYEKYENCWAHVFVDDMNEVRAMGQLLLDIADWHEEWVKKQSTLS